MAADGACQHEILAVDLEAKILDRECLESEAANAKLEYENELRDLLAEAAGAFEALRALLSPGTLPDSAPTPAVSLHTRHARSSTGRTAQPSQYTALLRTQRTDRVSDTPDNGSGLARGCGGHLAAMAGGSTGEW